jgi:hypothetical protein
MFSPWWLLAPLGGFVAAVLVQTRIERRQRLAQRAICVYQHGIARLEDRWAGLNPRAHRAAPPHHLYAADLDLFGRASLFDLLCTARTHMGEETLAEWLLTTAEVPEIVARQGAIVDLRPRLDLREAMAVAGASPLRVARPANAGSMLAGVGVPLSRAAVAQPDAPSDPNSKRVGLSPALATSQEASAALPQTTEDSGVALHPEALLAWAEAANPLPGIGVRLAALGLALLAVVCVVLWGRWDLLAPLAAVLVVEYAVAYALRHRLDMVFHGTDRGLAHLQLLAALLVKVEAESFRDPRLVALQAALGSGSHAGSKAVARLASLADWVESRHNPFVRLIDVPLGLSIQTAYAVQAWRAEYGQAVRGWLAALGEIEALLALAGYSYEHPADVFPEFVDSAVEAQFGSSSRTIETGNASAGPSVHSTYVAEQIGHPLIPAAVCVRNDVRIAGGTRALVISGSNMSGKSTLMRAVGLNAVLAMAGAPVRARSLRMTPMRVGASILVNDSLEEGSSRFYAEILRMQQICALAKEGRPVLFLLDELLQGTNSHDRLIGATGIVHALLDAGAIGILSTHDLALTALAKAGSDVTDSSIDGGLRNMHLQDAIENGRMVFDYTLRDGVVTKSNGVELMRLVGLDV